MINVKFKREINQINKESVSKNMTFNVAIPTVTKM